LFCLLIVTLVACTLTEAHSLFRKEEAMSLFTEFDDNDNSDDEPLQVRSDETEEAMANSDIFDEPITVRGETIMFDDSPSVKRIVIPKIFDEPITVRTPEMYDEPAPVYNKVQMVGRKFFDEPITVRSETRMFDDSPSVHNELRKIMAIPRVFDAPTPEMFDDPAPVYNKVLLFVPKFSDEPITVRSEG
jgi:hypothetical protein